MLDKPALNDIMERVSYQDLVNLGYEGTYNDMLYQYYSELLESE